MVGPCRGSCSSPGSSSPSSTAPTGCQRRCTSPPRWRAHGSSPWRRSRSSFAEREIGIELLMTVGALAAGGLGEWGEAAMLVFLYSISEALEEFTESRTEGAIRALMDLAPKTVTLAARRPAGRDTGRAAGRSATGSWYGPARALATDGTIVDGASALDESAVTGESIPVEKTVGQKVFAGTLNGTGVLTVEATATHENNTLAKIVHLVTEAQEEKGRAQRFMERFTRVYSPGRARSAACSSPSSAAPPAATGTSGLERAATVIVAAAPCALVISIPVTYVAAIGNAGRRGILVKGGIVLEDLATVDRRRLRQDRHPHPRPPRARRDHHRRRRSTKARPWRWPRGGTGQRAPPRQGRRRRRHRPQRGTGRGDRHQRPDRRRHRGPPRRPACAGRLPEADRRTQPPPRRLRDQDRASSRSPAPPPSCSSSTTNRGPCSGSPTPCATRPRQPCRPSRRPASATP